jgi:hypothetical protein
VVSRELVELDAEDRCADPLPGCEESSRPAGRIEHGDIAGPTRGNERLEHFAEQFCEPIGREVLRVLGCVELPESECVICVAAGVGRAGRHVD